MPRSSSARWTSTIGECVRTFRPGEGLLIFSAARACSSLLIGTLFGCILTDCFEENKVLETGWLSEKRKVLGGWL